jgi:hybrid cluster-associated redox disulfide protein
MTSVIRADMIINDVLEEHPETLSVFLHFDMDCYGCSMARFETIADGAAIYHVGVDVLLQELNESVAKSLTAADGRRP